MIDKIKKYGLCLGCGLCSSILGSDKCKMELKENGFYSPKITGTLDKRDTSIIARLCPGIRMIGKPHKGIWGPIISICQAWSSDKEIRFKAASGGVVTSLAIYLLEQKKVDAILQVGVRDDSYLYNELHISRTKEDVIKNAQSRYAPALVFHQIKEILDSETSTFALIGKPCDMAAMQNLIRVFPQYEGRVKYYISIFCAGMPSYNATIKTWQQSGHRDEPITLKYRGDGWPGYFKAVFSDGNSYQISYNDSWGKVLGRQLSFRCKICPDGIGMLADIAVGDSWNTKDGYPDFTEDDGRCFCMIRTEKGVKLIAEATQEGYIEKHTLDFNNIKNQQKYQFQRRKLTGWRLIPVQMFTNGLLCFKGFGIVKLALSANIREGIRNSIGTMQRLRRNK